MLVPINDLWIGVGAGEFGVGTFFSCPHVHLVLGWSGLASRRGFMEWNCVVGAISCSAWEIEICKYSSELRKIERKKGGFVHCHGVMRDLEQERQKGRKKEKKKKK